MSSEHFNNKMMGLGEPKVKFNINLVASSSLKLSQSKPELENLKVIMICFKESSRNMRLISIGSKPIMETELPP